VTHRILIVDDCQPVRDGIRGLIQGHEGWEICGEAVDGPDAIRKACHLAPDVIVLDFFMPVLNGIEVAREIAAKCPIASVILCSMYLDSQLADMARSAGIKGILSKSNVGQIVNCIETVLRGESYFASTI
jgi:DNA-binding NarL/FixJ family response regulator